MTVELDGNVRMRGDTGPGVRVQVLADGERLRLVSGNELVGDWDIGQIGVHVLQDGFSVRAEGEEFILRTDDDVALADAIGVAAASPRLARRIAARHNPDEPPDYPEPTPIRSNLGAVGYALAGGLVVFGGTFLNFDGGSANGAGSDGFGLIFIIAGVLMIAVAFMMSLGVGLSRVLAGTLLFGVVVAFGILIGDIEANVTVLTAYGLIAGGVVVGIAVLVSGSTRRED